MKAIEPTYKPYGKKAILIEWEPKIDEKILKNIINYKNVIQKNHSKVIVEVITSYNSLTVIYHSTIENIYNEILALKSIFQEKYVEKNQKIYRHIIPVCYDQKFALDLTELSDIYDLQKEEIIGLHSQPDYTVFCIGFLPGFLYLGGLPKKAHFPRRAIPRLEVERGSVGIGGAQTGIYPQNSSGGWNIIGNSPLSFFDLSKDEPCFAKVGDKIKFKPIDMEEYQKIKTQVDIGFYEIEKELLNA